MRRFLQRLWPKTLFAQLLVIMVFGVLGIQLASSSIWFDVRFAQVLEAPVRLMARDTAAIIEQIDCRAPEQLQVRTHYQLRCLSDAPPRVPGGEPSRAQRRIELLLGQALRIETGRDYPLRLLSATLTDTQGQPIVWHSLFGLRTAQAHLRFALQLPDQRWLHVEAQEMQGWSGESAWVLIADYLLRVYALRILAVLVICLVAVRLCLRPLKRLGEAAMALGDNLEQPPLTIEGSQEVRQAALAFNSMQQRLKAMLDDQAYFLAAVSHDLRTPLTRMRLLIERVSEERPRERLRHNIVEMERMIAQVLDYLQSAEKHTVQPVDIDELLARLCDELCSAEEPLPVSGRGGVVQVNELLLQRCLQNLLSNALRYARQVSLNVQSDDQHLHIEILDRGPGIAEQQLPTITDPFVRGEASRNQRSGGYGLGLSIAKRIAMLHGGRLMLRNREAGGLSVSVLLPLHQPALHQ
ncbi:ATP-binding protein [Pseudomonas sp. 21LCFQ02]|uniref:ATP-binding protein n=1 Tax=unclassified Pseudomonas TaxID=196821 RepID=UPI0004F705DB|nr:MULTISPECIES: ATP-binding protein [unclassified Pseudomonas]MCO8166969.1 ATP-binding protein [Pseudomonas sp. 21LCFQ02]BAP42293.1 integral membrane sensor signal transduction histidine kinase [Pseudomonas sp. StFLB209]